MMGAAPCPTVGVRAGDTADPCRLVAVPTTSEGARLTQHQKSALGTGKQRDTLDNEFAELFRLRIGIITRQESDAEGPRQAGFFLLVSYASV